MRRAQQRATADAAGLAPADDLAHLPRELQATALWALGDGGFERRVVRGMLAPEGREIDVTAFDLETLRERRGEWAYLPVDPPFRIAPVVSVVACVLPRDVPHVLFKQAGFGDLRADDDALQRVRVTKIARDLLMVPRSYAAEMPSTLPAEASTLALPAQWRGYTRAAEAWDAILRDGLAVALERAGRRDLVVELVGRLAIVYPAAHDVGGADAMADLVEAAIVVAEAIRVPSGRL